MSLSAYLQPALWPDSDIVCDRCIVDSEARRRMSDWSVSPPCACCGQLVTRGLSAAALADMVYEPLKRFFEIDPGLYRQRDWSLADIVSQALNCSDVASKFISDQLEEGDTDSEGFFAPGQRYMWRKNFDDEEHEQWYVCGDWHNAIDNLTYRQRYFNSTVEEYFRRLVDTALEAKSVWSPEHCAVVNVMRAGTPVYRARIAKSIDELNRFREAPAKELGAAPRAAVRNNRMNPSGVPLLYVSAERETCIAEVRPNIGDTVVIARFTTTRFLRLFDFTRLSGPDIRFEPISLLTDDAEQRLHRRSFLRHLGELIARPVRSGDREYVATQALAAYLQHKATVPGAQGQPERFDGIAFKSAQHAGGLNYVLFEPEMPLTDWHQDAQPDFPVTLDTQSGSVVAQTITGITYATSAGGD